MLLISEIDFQRLQAESVQTLEGDSLGVYVTWFYGRVLSDVVLLFHTHLYPVASLSMHEERGRGKGPARDHL